MEKEVIVVKPSYVDAPKASPFNRISDSQADWNEENPEQPGYIKNKPDLDEVLNYQPDWEVEDPNEKGYIKNKPDLSKIDNIGAAVDIVDFPTENIRSNNIYRLLKGVLYLKGQARYDCNCRIVHWGINNENRPKIGANLVIGQVSNYNFEDISFNLYYNLDNNNLYGYFDDSSVAKINSYIDSQLNTAVASFVKSFLKGLVANNRWLALSDILVSTITPYIKIKWGGVIGDTSEIDLSATQTVYLLLYTELYGYLEEKWVQLLKEPARMGEGKASVVFNHLSNIASGDMSAAFGNQTKALGSSSFAGGYLSVANGPTGFAFGDHVISSSICFSIGKYNISSYNNIFEVGCGTEQTRKNALDIQQLTGNINFYTPAIFNSSIQIKGYISFAAALSGEYRLVFESGSLCWQYWLGSNKGSSHKLITEGTLPQAFKNHYIQTGAKYSNNVEANSTAEGINNVATGLVSHAEGSETQALGVTAHSEGYGTQALADYSHAEGINTEARGMVSHAEGYATIAEGPYSHTEGQNCSTTIEALWAHAEGVNTVALAMATHVEGNNTIAASYCQHVQGQFNLVDEETKYAHIVGKGADDDNRSNAHTLDWNGNAWFAGAVLIGGESMYDENAELLITSGVLTKLLNKLSEKGIEISIDELLS